MDAHEWFSNQFWDVYQRIVYIRCYYHRYRENKYRWKRFWGVILIIFSLAGFSGLWFWQKIPHVWSVLSLLAQIISASAYLFPYSEDIQALNYLIPELESLEHKMELDYCQMSSFEDIEIIMKTFSYQEQWLALEQKYTDSSHFPFHNRCKKKADKDKLAFIQERFGTPETQQ